MSLNFARPSAPRWPRTKSFGAPVTWVLSNHDIDRHVTRYGRGPTAHPLHGPPDEPVDIALGTRRARAAILMMLALPGAVYLYQGEELGLPQVNDIPEVDAGRPGVGAIRPHPPRPRRLPRAAAVDADRARRSDSAQAEPWLPQPADWSNAVGRSEEADRTSMLWLYRDASAPAPRAAGAAARRITAWLDLGEEVIAFTRGDRIRVRRQLRRAAVELPAGEVLLSSVPLEP